MYGPRRPPDTAFLLAGAFDKKPALLAALTGRIYDDAPQQNALPSGRPSEFMLLAISVIHRVWRDVLDWLDMRLEAPIMRRHVNHGSNKYFAHAEENRGASELDYLLGPAGDDDEGDDQPEALAETVPPAA